MACREPPQRGPENRAALCNHHYGQKDGMGGAGEAPGVGSGSGFPSPFRPLRTAQWGPGAGSPVTAGTMGGSRREPQRAPKHTHMDDAVTQEGGGGCPHCALTLPPGPHGGSDTTLPTSERAAVEARRGRSWTAPVQEALGTLLGAPDAPATASLHVS